MRLLQRSQSDPFETSNAMGRNGSSGREAAGQSQRGDRPFIAAERPYSSADSRGTLNLIAAAQGRTSEQPRVLIWGQDPVFAAREGKWKLWQSIAYDRVELYDLQAASAELKDVSKDHPEIVQHLVSKISAWRATLPPPLWARRFARQLPSCKKETTWVY
ncbi:hypothetical protein [Cupriavidus taiwanensis]|uniref:hypothetical protein n=1 Tax=Cupriavidus taiwanensis TaxID=164546 RepID=UPI0011C03D67|nr:hypothetical protein [Cupriavidus taiwanensis]